ncbi:MAG: histidinol-phosphate transaminase, partial [Alphaproteobacteria bacterium]
MPPVSTDSPPPPSSAARPQPRPGLLAIEPYVGGSSRLPGFARPTKLSANESAFGPSPKAAEAVRQLAGELHRYPDGDSTDLRAAIAAGHGVPAEHVLCGTGSDEVIGLLVRAYAGAGDEVLFTRHAFAMYPIATLAAGATPVTVEERDLRADVDALIAGQTERTRIVCLANPNNPTGTYIPADELRRLRRGLRDDVLLIIDSAYA